ncbi:MAG: tRNA (adenosine(37)-N6)-threonylcarbamoyltransferase complex dimerization subunit type 1 TsaB [Tissierellia bacterium]|jgi:tRNA threonylcarbamoyladenosine biosynthesis protein TsaB|nr:tRNA (adenosine(37)-N6)-threonylcarbamoyltransferase complex dimerization subunit type 1 TsaB [Tissierellia bacterium]
MKILSIESASVTASCCVSEGENILGEYTLRHKKTHSEKLMPLIEELMKELELKINDIDLIAVSKGPGSYTGLRIGAAIAKSLAFAADIKIAGVPTMKSLAANVYDEDKLIVPIMDAKAGRIYTGVYKWQNGECKEVLEQFPCNIDELIEILNDYKEPIIFNGDGSVNYRDRIENVLNSKIYFAPEVFNYLKATTLAFVAFRMAVKGETVSAKDFKPQYLRLSQAERNKK